MEVVNRHHPHPICKCTANTVYLRLNLYALNIDLTLYVSMFYCDFDLLVNEHLRVHFVVCI